MWGWGANRQAGFGLFPKCPAYTFSRTLTWILLERSSFGLKGSWFQPCTHSKACALYSPCNKDLAFLTLGFFLDSKVIHEVGTRQIEENVPYHYPWQPHFLVGNFPEAMWWWSIAPKAECGWSNSCDSSALCSCVCVMGNTVLKYFLFQCRASLQTHYKKERKGCTHRDKQGHMQPLGLRLPTLNFHSRSHIILFPSVKPWSMTNRKAMQICKRVQATPVLHGFKECATVHTYAGFGPARWCYRVGWAYACSTNMHSTLTYNPCTNWVARICIQSLLPHI